MSGVDSVACMGIYIVHIHLHKVMSGVILAATHKMTLAHLNMAAFLNTER